MLYLEFLSLMVVQFKLISFSLMIDNIVVFFQDPALLEFAWIELVEKNKSITVEELAEVYLLHDHFCIQKYCIDKSPFYQMMFGSAEPLESYSAYLLLSKDDIYFTTLETKGSYSIYGPRPAVQVFLQLLLVGI